MNKKQVHEILKGFHVNVRKGRAIVFLGYIGAPENYMQYSPEREAKAMQILGANSIQFQKETKREFGFGRIDLTFTI